MRGPLFPVSLVSIYLLVYATLALFGQHPNWVLLMFLFSPALVIWMVYSVLRNGKPSGKTFDEHFYEDRDLRRSPVDA